jgi:hypothetical protein
MKEFKIFIIFLVLAFFVGCTTTQETNNLEQNSELVDPLQGQENELPEIVASVNGELITSDEIQNIASQMQMYGVSLSNDELIEQSIRQRLLLQLIQEQVEDFSKEEIEEVLIEQGVSLDELKLEIESQGLDYDEILNEYYANEVKLIYFISEIQNEIVVTEEEMISFFEQQSMLMEEELVYDEVEEEIYDTIFESKTNEILMSLIDEFMQESEIETYY